MDDKTARAHIDDVLQRLELRELEARIAPVKCDKHPEHPDCQADTLYGVDTPLYGIETDEPG